MKKSYTHALERLTKKKDELLDAVEAHDSKYIITRKNNRWSPLEHCYHLYLAEHISRKYCVKKLSFNPLLEDIGMGSQLRIWGLKLMEVVPLKFKAPEAISEQVFPADLNVESVRHQWSAERVELKRFLADLDPALYSKQIYRHPMVGRLSIDGMLEFFLFHIDRHAQHVKRYYGIR